MLRFLRTKVQPRCTPNHPNRMRGSHESSRLAHGEHRLSHIHSRLVTGADEEFTRPRHKKLMRVHVRVTP